jgi:hypothetical protein
MMCDDAWPAVGGKYRPTPLLLAAWLSPNVPEDTASHAHKGGGEEWEGSERKQNRKRTQVVKVTAAAHVHGQPVQRRIHRTRPTQRRKKVCRGVDHDALEQQAQDEHGQREVKRAAGGPVDGTKGHVQHHRQQREHDARKRRTPVPGEAAVRPPKPQHNVVRWERKLRRHLRQQPKEDQTPRRTFQVRPELANHVLVHDWGGAVAVAFSVTCLCVWLSAKN